MNSTAVKSLMSGNSQSEKTQTFLSKGCVINGELRFVGVSQIDCTVVGNIESTDTFTLLENGSCKGNIIGKDLVIAGSVDGDIEADGNLTLLSSAVINGNIKTKTLTMKAGVQFNGQCSMG